MTSCHLVLGAAGLLLAIGLVMVFSASAIEAALDGSPAWAPGRPAARLGGARRGRHAGRAAAAHGPAAAVVADRAARRRRPAAARPRARHRAEAQRRPAVVRPRLRQLPARPSWPSSSSRCGAPTSWRCASGYLTIKSLLVPVLPVFAVLSLLLIAEPDFGGVVSLGLVLVGLLWAGGMPLRYFGFALAGGVVLVVVLVQVGALPDGPHHRVPRPVRRPHRRRLPGHPRHVRAGHRRAVGRRARQQRDEVEPAAARPVRLHLRDHRRGARLPRLPGGRHPLRRPGLRRLPDRPPRRRPVHPAGQRGHHRLADRPGGHEHGLRGGSAAGHRRPVAADLRGRHVAGAHAVHRRAARPLRPGRAGGDRGPAHPVRAAAWPASCCRCRPRRSSRCRLPRLRPEGRAPQPARRGVLPAADAPATPAPSAAAGRAPPATALGRTPAPGPGPDDPPAQRRPGRGGHRRAHRADARPGRRAAPPATRSTADHLPRHRPRHGDPARPRPRLRAAADPAGAAPAEAHPRPAPRARPGAPRRGRDARRARRGAGRRRRRVRRVRGAAGVPGRAAGGGIPIVVHEQNALPGAGQPRRRADRRARGGDRSRHAAAPGRARRHAAADGDQLAGPDRAAAPRPAPSSAWTPTGRRCSCSAARRAPPR